MNRKIALLLLTSAIFVLNPAPAWAVTETSSTFEVTWDDPLFSEENTSPGDEFEKSVKVTNLTNEEQTLNIRFEDQNETSDNLSSQIVFNVFRNSGSLLNDTVDKLFDENEVELLTMASEEKDLELIFKTEFKKEAGNEYQGKGTKFNIVIGGVTVPAVLAAETAPKEEGVILGLATGANLVYSFLGSLAALSTGLYLRRRTSSSSETRS